MTTHATGAFDVKVTPQESTGFDSPLGKMSLDKQFHGDLEGPSKGEMMTFFNPVNNSRAYVAIEKFSGTLGGRTGTFGLMHQGTMTSAGQALTVVVAPGSGTDELEGLEGTLSIKIIDKKHLYEFDYTLPSSEASTSPHAERDRLNPYAKFLGDEQPLPIVRATPSKLAKLIAGVPEAALTRSPAPGKWSVRDILCHLADTELVFGFRLRQTVAQPSHVIQPFDQDAWAEPMSKLSAHDALDAFTEFRKWNLLFIDAVGPSMLSKRVTHPERGEMTFQNLLETMGGHDINHLRQIEPQLAP